MNGLGMILGGIENACDAVSNIYDREQADLIRLQDAESIQHTLDKAHIDDAFEQDQLRDLDMAVRMNSFSDGYRPFGLDGLEVKHFPKYEWEK